MEWGAAHTLYFVYKGQHACITASRLLYDHWRCFSPSEPPAQHIYTYATPMTPPLVLLARENERFVFLFSSTHGIQTGSTCSACQNFFLKQQRKLFLLCALCFHAV